MLINDATELYILIALIPSCTHYDYVGKGLNGAHHTLHREFSSSPIASVLQEVTLLIKLVSKELLLCRNTVVIHQYILYSEQF